MARRRVRSGAALTALVALVAWPGTSVAVAATHSATASATTPGPTATAAGSPGVTGNPFGGANPISPVQTPTASASTTTAAVATSTTSGGSSLSTGSALAIAVGAIALLGGISYFIWRDARRRAPVKSHGYDAGLAGNGRRAGSKPPPKPRKLSSAERKRRKRGRARR